jgi:hypothetical protein
MGYRYLCQDLRVGCCSTEERLRNLKRPVAGFSTQFLTVDSMSSEVDVACVKPPLIDSRGNCCGSIAARPVSKGAQVLFFAIAPVELYFQIAVILN